MGPKKKKGCITILLCMIIFAVSGGCVENKITNTDIEAGDNIESPRVESPDSNNDGGGM